MITLRHGFVALCAIVTTSLATAGSAFALSCLRPSIDTSFHSFNDAPELYRVYTGTWRPLERVPNVDGSNNNSLRGSLPSVRYQFTGQAIGRSGPSGQFQTLNVDVQPTCAGPWCANYPAAGPRQVVFLEDVSGNVPRFRFSEGPCGGGSFTASSANVTALVDCLNGRNCARNHPGDVDPQPRPDPDPVGDSCGANGPISQFVGSRVENVPAELYPPRVRFIRPGDAVTQDYVFERLNVELSNTAIVRRFRCG